MEPSVAGRPSASTTDPDQVQPPSDAVPHLPSEPEELTWLVRDADAIDRAIGFFSMDRGAQVRALLAVLLALDAVCDVDGRSLVLAATHFELKEWLGPQTS
jgi:hypothetical protein